MSRQRAAPLGDVAREDSSRMFVSGTARSVAAMRAVEHAKGADSLIDDPYASVLAGPEVAGDRFAWLSQVDFMVHFLAVRTKYIDEFIAATVTGAEGPRQVVVLGSGLDSRPYRLACLAPCTVFELDFDEVHRYKSQTLAAVGAKPVCTLVCVATDLSRPSWASDLSAAGFSRERPTLWLLEGLTGYLTEMEAANLFSTLRALSATGSACLATMLGSTYEVAGPGTGPSSLHSFFCDTGAEFVKGCGWEVASQTLLGELAAAFGRGEDIPLTFGYSFVEAHASPHTPASAVSALKDARAKY